MNILYLHAHDLGRELGCYGSPARTPQLDALAARAIRFDRAYCAAPTCSPSRAALLTGQWPHETGMLGLAHRGFSLAHPERHLAAWLRSHGWHTALCGIQHEFSGAVPYDHVAATSGTAGTRDRSTAEAARAFLEASPPRPFFLSCGFFGPHREFPEPDLAAYPPAALPLPEWVPDDPACRRDYSGFLTAVSRMDHEAGRVLAALERSRHAADTLIVFTTDHGPAFPGAKCQLTEAGLGVALVIADPGRPGGRGCDALVSHVDIFPTLCDRLGLRHPAWLRGTSLLPLLDGAATAVRAATFAEVSYHAAYEPQRGIVTRDALHVRRFDARPRPVFPNIDDSPTKDWFARQPRAVACPALHDNAAHDLAARLEEWMRQAADPLLAGPVPAPPGVRLNAPDGYSPAAAPQQPKHVR